MAFMRPDIYLGYAYLVETTSGTEIVPADVVTVPRDADTVLRLRVLAPYLTGAPDPGAIVSESFGYFARLSAPGYLDCTDWSGPYSSATEAEDALSEMYGDDSGDAE